MYMKHSIAVLTSILLGSCSFEHGCSSISPICDLIDDRVPESELLSPERNVKFQEDDRIIAFHGSSCAESNQPGEKKILRVEENLEIPPYATQATVFLNGWRVRYLSKDHHVLGFGTAISNIRLEGKTLKWQAMGVLSDKNFDDGYRWCYHYTAIAWNPANIKLIVDHKDASCRAGDPVDLRQTNFFGAGNWAGNEETTTALSSFPTFIYNPNLASSKTVAILPRGFGTVWGCGASDEKDHHLFQIAYNLDHSEVFVETQKKYKKGGEDITPLPDSTSPVGLIGSGHVSWETSAIFKDNDTRRNYSFGEIVSGLGGDDVGVIQPPFSILPHEDAGWTTSCFAGPGARAEEFEVDNIPYEFAIPVLTGWDLEYGCGDQHVAEMGIGILAWNYDKNTGKMHYTLVSRLRDRDNNPDPDFIHRHKVTILGIKRVTRGTPLQRVPDLVPFSPLGTDFKAFCRLEQDRRLLRVSVKNQGNENAAVSKTSVFFRNGPVTLDTPPIPAGGSTDLLFEVPAQCFNPDCSFKITVDSGNQVDESGNEGNNNANGGCRG